MADELARRDAVLQPSIVSCSLSFSNCIHLSLSIKRPTDLSKFFDTPVFIRPSSLCLYFFLFLLQRRSLLLSSYLYRIGRIENPSCNACDHPMQNLSSLSCPATDFLHHPLFGDSLSICNLWCRSWGVAKTLGFLFRGRNQILATTTIPQYSDVLSLRRF